MDAHIKEGTKVWTFDYNIKKGTYKVFRCTVKQRYSDGCYEIAYGKKTDAVYGHYLCETKEEATKRLLENLSANRALFLQDLQRHTQGVTDSIHAITFCNKVIGELTK